MRADEAVRFGFQYPEVEPRGHMPRAIDFEGRHVAVIPNPVAISFSLRAETRVELRGHVGATHNPNFHGQECIEGAGPAFQFHAARSNIRMRTLRERMHAGVRAPRSVHANAFARHAREGALENILDCVAARLTLPAGERRAVIRDGELQPVRPSLARELRTIELALPNPLRRDPINEAAVLPCLPVGTL